MLLFGNSKDIYNIKDKLLTIILFSFEIANATYDKIYYLDFFIHTTAFHKRPFILKTKSHSSIKILAHSATRAVLSVLIDKLKIYFKQLSITVNKLNLKMKNKNNIEIFNYYTKI